MSTPATSPEIRSEQTLLLAFRLRNPVLDRTSKYVYVVLTLHTDCILFSQPGGRQVERPPPLPPLPPLPQITSNFLVFYGLSHGTTLK